MPRIAFTQLAFHDRISCIMHNVQRTNDKKSNTKHFYYSILNWEHLLITVSCDRNHKTMSFSLLVHRSHLWNCIFFNIIFGCKKDFMMLGQSETNHAAGVQIIIMKIKETDMWRRPH